ncbi:GNAT family N-acetyltransferase [Polaribacter sp.]|nr:GNAT family N-acetyltransferase [Polaribacter sp.]MDB9848780.1 GNAT family N-acetyltransferase [Polaribacter sp.]MDC0085865.1 GNAT family N-acetyltransferase [Polaribacter sp.]
MKIRRTNSENKDFVRLIIALDAYLKITDEDEHDFYNQFNNIDVLSEVVVVYEDIKTSSKPIAIGCAAMKKFDHKTVEIKRMYVSPEKRGTGIAQKIMQELEDWARELNYEKCILETGKRQVEAVHFYHKCNYKMIENYGQYKGMQNSICFEKYL